MVHIELARDREGEGGALLRVRGTLDGSAAWRLCRVAARLSLRRPLRIDLSGVDRILTFGAAVLGARLPLLGPGVRLEGVRPEHARVLRLSGAYSVEG